MTEPDPSDELLARYRDANAADPQQPAERVRAAVRQHAQMVQAGQQAGAALPSNSVQSSSAANQSRWKISALGSIAVLGLAGLLVLQFEHGTPEQKEVALGVPVPGESRKDEAVRPSEPVAVALKEDTAPRLEPPPASALSQAIPAAANPTVEWRTRPSAPPLVREPARSTKAAAPDVGTQASPAPSAFPRSAEIAPGAALRLAGDATSPATPASRLPITAQANAPAAAVPGAAADQAAPRVRNMGATGELEKAQAPPALARTLRERAPSTVTSSESVASLHTAARNGDVAQLDRLLAQGALLNAPDEAGRTPLMLAAMGGHIEAVRRLLAAGANPALLDREGLDAVQHARRLGLTQIVQLIEARR